MRWVIDEEGDIGFQFFFVTFIKYKDYVLVRWFKRYPLAPRWLDVSELRRFNYE